LKFYIFCFDLQDKPEAYVRSPANSLIIEVRATEIIQSASYPTNFTLRYDWNILVHAKWDFILVFRNKPSWIFDYFLIRFPRFEKLRRDKDWIECMSMTELLEMTNTLKKKNAPGSEDEDEQ